VTINWLLKSIMLHQHNSNPTYLSTSLSMDTMDVDTNVRVYLCDERILTYRSVGVARCRLPRKKVDFFT